MTPASIAADAAAAQGRTFEVQNATIKRNEDRLKLLEMLQDADGRLDKAKKGENVVLVEAVQAIYDGLVHDVKEIIERKRNGQSQ